MFNVGDKVRIAPTSLLHNRVSSRNPSNTTGTVIAGHSTAGFPYQVMWLTGETNVYQDTDLVKVPEIKLSDLVGKKYRMASPEISAAFQKLLFALGHPGWGGARPSVGYIYGAYLYVYENRITFGNASEGFERMNYLSEGSVEEILSRL